MAATPEQKESNTYVGPGSALHAALAAVVAEVRPDLRPAILDRELADLDPSGPRSPARVARSVLHRLGLTVTLVEPGKALPPDLEGSALLCVGAGRHIVVANPLAGRRRIRLSEIQANGEASSERVSRREVLARIQTSPSTVSWLLVSPTRGLDSLAEPGGHISPWRRLARLLKLERRDVWVVALYALTIGALTLLTPIAAQALVNTIAFGAILQPLVVLTFALLIGLSFAGTMSILQAYVVEVLQRRTLVRLAEDLGNRLPMVAEAARDRRDLVELNNRFLDVITIQKSWFDLLVTGGALVLQTVVGMILLAFYHPALLAFDLVLILGLSIVVWLGRGATTSAVAESKAKFAVAAWLDELARSPNFAAGHGRAVSSQELSHRTRAYVRARASHYRTVFSVLVGGVGLQVLSLVLLLGVGGWLVIERQLTLGQLIAAEIIVSAVAAGIGKLGHLAEKAFDMTAATDKIGHLLDLPLRTDGSDAVQSSAQPMALSCRGLLVGYGGDTPVAAVGDADIVPGARVLVDGKTASGRSALLETVATRRSPLGGRLTWDRRSKPRLADSYKQIVLVRGEQVAATTIFTNLRLGNAALSTTDAWEALAAVGLSEVVDRLPDGLDCKVLPSGSPLSASQLDRLALARALVSRPRLLLIDGALDRLAEDDDGRAIIERFIGKDAPWTAIVVTQSNRVRSYLDTSLTVTSITSKEVA